MQTTILALAAAILGSLALGAGTASAASPTIAALRAGHPPATYVAMMSKKKMKMHHNNKNMMMHKKMNNKNMMKNNMM